MGNIQSINKINFEDIQKIIKNDYNAIIINTLSINNQDCLIKKTIHGLEEENVLNSYIRKDKNINIIIYGENSIDNKIINKYNQLYKLGFYKLYVYVGGLFEWLLLQDIYGADNFPTTIIELDHLKYRAKSTFNYLLEDID